MSLRHDFDILVNLGVDQLLPHRQGRLGKPGMGVGQCTRMPWIGSLFIVKRVDLAQQQVNQQTQARNAVLDADVRDLKQGTEAAEERARSELGMIKCDEVFYQFLEQSSGQQQSAPASSVHDAKR